MQELRYRGANDDDPSRLGHAVQSRCLAVLLCTLPGKRQLPQISKGKCLLLLSLLLQAAVGGLATSQVETRPIEGCIYDLTHTPQNVMLAFDENGMTHGLSCLLESDECASAWQKLASAGWCGRKVTSALDNLSIWDLALFLAWAKARANQVWNYVLPDMYPKIVEYMGRWKATVDSWQLEAPSQCQCSEPKKVMLEGWPDATKLF